MKKILPLLIAAALSIAGLTPAQAAPVPVPVPTYDLTITTPTPVYTVEQVGDKLWSAGVLSRKVYIIDKATGVIDQTIDLAGTGNIIHSSVDANYLWLSNLVSAHITRVNLSTKVAENISLASNKDIVSDGTYAWVASASADKVYRLDASTGAILSETPLLDPFTVDSDGTNVWVSYDSGRKLAKLNHSTGAVVLSEISSGLVSPTEVAQINFNADSMFIAPNGGLITYQRSLADGSLIRSITNPIGGGTGLALPYQGTLWLLLSGASSSAQFNMVNFTAGAPTYEGSFFHGNGIFNGLYDGSSLWLIDVVGGLKKYTASYEPTVTNTAPSAPGTPTATAGNATANLEWTAPETGSAPITYTVTSSPAGANCVVTGTTAACTGLTNGTEYTFKITATNSVDSADSGFSSAVTPAAPSITTNVSQVSRYGEVIYTVTGLQYESEGAPIGLFVDEVWFDVGALGNGSAALPWAFWTTQLFPAPALAGLGANTKFTVRYYGANWDGLTQKSWSDPYEATSDVTHMAGAGSEWFNAQPATGGPGTQVNITSFWSLYQVLMTNGASSAVFRIAGQSDTTFTIDNVQNFITGTITIGNLPISGVYEVTVMSSGAPMGTFTFTYVATPPRAALPTPPNHFVTYLPNGGVGVSAKTGSNSPAPLASNWFVNLGYVFTGWNTQADGTGSSFLDGANFTFDADITLYAQWKLVKGKKYISTFGGNSATLKPGMKKSISSWVTALPTNTQIVCQGSTFGKRVSASDKALATKRAKNVCNYAKKIRGDLKFTITTNPSSSSKNAARHVWIIQN